MRNTIKDFTADEIQSAKERCHFTPYEEQLFNLRAQDLSLEECAELLNISTKTAIRYNKRVMDKLQRVSFVLHLL